MRELKFRAWDEGGKIMHNDFQFIKSGNDGNDWIVFTSDKQKLSDKPHPFENPCFQQQLKIIQFTGIHDKNGKEIYEGDICKIKFDLNKVENHIFLLLTEKEKTKQEKVFIVESPMFNNQPELNADYIQVIGNIYENPELLK